MRRYLEYNATADVQKAKWSEIDLRVMTYIATCEILGDGPRGIPE
jgi:hypothetical protein